MLINVVKNFAVETPFVLEKNKYQIIKANTRFGNKVDLNFNNEKCWKTSFFITSRDTWNKSYSHFIFNKSKLQKVRLKYQMIHIFQFYFSSRYGLLFKSEFLGKARSLGTPVYFNTKIF